MPVAHSVHNYLIQGRVCYVGAAISLDDYICIPASLNSLANLSPSFLFIHLVWILYKLIKVRLVVFSSFLS